MLKFNQEFSGAVAVMLENNNEATLYTGCTAHIAVLKVAEGYGREGESLETRRGICKTEQVDILTSQLPHL